MRINNNIMALNAHRQLAANQAAGSKSMERLSSGFRINRAGDDAAGLAISEKMRGQIRGLKQASRNAQDAISLIQTAEGALNETHSILQRMRELAVQSSTDTNTASDRKEIQAEMDELAKELSRISNTTEFNTQNLLAGGFNNIFHIGANKGQSISLGINSMDAFTLGVAGDLISTSVATANGIVGISEVSANLGTTPTVTVQSVTAATYTPAQGDIEGAITTTGSAYTGSEDLSYTFRLGDIGTGGAVNSIEYSTDGGTTYTTASVDSGNFDLGNGVKIQIVDNVSNATGQSGSLAVTAATAEIKLTNSDGDIGSAVTVRGNQSSVVVGDASTGRTANVAFNFGTLANGTAAINQAIASSSGAITDANGNVSTQALVKKGINVSTQAAANNAITKLNDAIEVVSSERSKLGAFQNRLEHTISNLGTSAENLQAAESRIRDVDMAAEIMEFTKANILNQAATAMLAQANAAPQSVLQLLG